MDDTLRLIRYLYGEDVSDSALRRQLSEDAGLRREYECLRETKERLDRRSPRRPDPAVVDRVVDAARTAAQESSGSSPSSRRAEDRSSRPPTPTWSRRLQTASTALALLLLGGLGLWQLPGASEKSTPTSSRGPTARRTASVSALEERRIDASAIPAWDQRDKLVRIHHRIEQLQARSAPGAWGELQTVSRTRP